MGFVGCFQSFVNGPTFVTVTPQDPSLCQTQQRRKARTCVAARSGGAVVTCCWGSRYESSPISGSLTLASEEHAMVTYLEACTCTGKGFCF